MRRLLALIGIVALALWAAACDINLQAPKELRLIVIECWVANDTITVNVPEGESYEAYCGEVPDSVVIVTP